MRVVSGKLKSKKLCSVKGLDIRPTSDRVKEAIFDILQDCFRGQNVLDLFAGTGALGIEALSRGARKAVFIEESRQSLNALRRNIEECRLKEQAEVWPREVQAGIRILQGRGESFELIFLDPPYGKELAGITLRSLAQSSIVAPGALIVAEHSLTDSLGSIEFLQMVDERKYGRTRVSFFRSDK